MSGSTPSFSTIADTSVREYPCSSPYDLCALGSAGKAEEAAGSTAYIPLQKRRITVLDRSELGEFPCIFPQNREVRMETGSPMTASTAN